MRLKSKKIFVYSGFGSLIFHLSHFLDWFNVYLMKQKIGIIDSIMNFYEAIELTTIGNILYFHLFVVGYNTSNHLLVKLWTLFSFIIVWLIIYKLILFLTTQITNQNKE